MLGIELRRGVLYTAFRTRGTQPRSDGRFVHIEIQLDDHGDGSARFGGG